MTQHQRRIQLVQVACLMRRDREPLADFEIGLIEEVCARVKADPDAIQAVTAAEWRVIEDAIAALRMAGEQAA
jgi:hypothetical protein